MPQEDGTPKAFGRRRWPPDGDGPATRGPSPPGPHDPNRMLAYDGGGRPLSSIVLRNTLLSLVTLGIYRFWGKTRLRRYLWSHLRLLGDRLEYTGTAKELFLGFLIALAVLIPLFFAYGLLDAFFATGAPLRQSLLQLIWYLLLGFLVGMALYRARRYRMTRTSWRGIRFGLTGSSVQYALRFVGYYLLVFLTLGLARPIADVRLQSAVLNNSWFGDGEFRFHGRPGDLFGRWVLCWLLIPFTFGLSLIWYAALRTRYFAEHTRFQRLQFALPVTFGDLARILLPYYLVVVLLFGLASLVSVSAGMDIIAKPNADVGGTVKFGAVGTIAFLAIFILLPMLQVVMITHRMIKLFADRLVLEGDADLDTIIQNAQTAPRTGEGLADALDVGGGVEIGF